MTSAEISAWANVGIAIGTLIAGMSALWAVNSWRNELVGKDEYEIARKMLILYYRAFFIIKQVERGPVDRDEELDLMREFDELVDAFGAMQTEANIFIPGFNSPHQDFLDCIKEWTASRMQIPIALGDNHSARLRNALDAGVHVMLKSVKPARFHKSLKEWWERMNEEMDRRDGVIRH